jgi:CubicO group peptidase (beta-lactamase class C family)
LLCEEGIGVLELFVDRIIEKKLELYGINIKQEGRLVGSHNFIPRVRHPIYSATKSFTSTAVGLAIEEKLLSQEDEILKYLEEDLPEDIPTETKNNLAKLTIKRLLTMSVPGYPFRPEGEDWLSFALSVPLSHVEREAFHYSNIPAYLVGVIVEKAVKQNLMDYLKPRLFEPLGITEPSCCFCPGGHFYGASGMSLTVEELSRLGQLYLQLGEWNGKQLLSPTWVEEATGKQIETREGGYGYYFWRCPDNGYLISGKWGQRCYVFPEKKLVITYMGNLQDNHDSEYVSKCMYETIYDKC